MKKVEITKSKFLIIFSLILFVFSVFFTESKAEYTEINLPSCRVCGWYGCDQAYSNQAGADACSSNIGLCYMLGNCCNNCKSVPKKN